MNIKIRCAVACLLLIQLVLSWPQITLGNGSNILKIKAKLPTLAHGVVPHLKIKKYWCLYTDREVWLSKNEGKSWQRININVISGGHSGIDDLSITSSGSIIILINGKPYITKDYGLNWSSLGFSNDLSVNKFVVAGDKVNDTYIFGGAFRESLAGHSATVIPKYAYDEHDGISSIIRPAISVISGDRIIKKYFRDSIGAIDKIAIADDTVVAIGPYVVVVSTDNADNWNSYEFLHDDIEEESYPTAATVYQKRIWIGLKNGFLMASSDDRYAAIKVYKFNGVINDIYFSSSDIGFCIVDGNIYKTDNAGGTWTQYSAVVDLSTFVFDGNCLYVINGENIYYVSNN